MKGASKTKKRISKMRRKLAMEMARKSTKIDVKAAKLMGREKEQKARKKK